MTSEPTPEFDVGPLSWVQGEIDQALTRGIEALVTFRSNPADLASLKHARAHIHQAAGAIQMVGLDAVVVFSDEIERQLVRAEELDAADVPQVVDRVDRACRRLQVFLDEIANGTPPVPLKLFPEYESMQKARGQQAPAHADLFYPDLTVRSPRAAPREIVPAASLASHMLNQRRVYQRGLLEWLRSTPGSHAASADVVAGGALMRSAIAAIEDLTAQPSLRAFWWTVGAFLEALEHSALERSFGAKQLIARIDMQIRRVTEGSAKVADRLRREVLYFVAISAPVTPQIDEVQRAYHLAALVPSAEALNADVVRLQPLLREAREQLANAKDAWIKVASGRGENLARLRQLLESVDSKASEVRLPALARLTSVLVDRVARMPTGSVAEPVAMEFATALLLAESAFENFTNLAPDFPKHVDAMLARLDAASAGKPSVSGAPMLDEMSKRAQERVLLSQVMHEVQANLRHMEQVLDAFFRDNQRRADLAGLARDSQQIRGALRILNLDDADRLLELCQAQIESYADPQTRVDDEGLESLAESLSGLGFYIEAVLQQRPDRERILAPLIAKRLGEAPKPVAAIPQSVEDSVAELRAALPRLLADVRNAPANAEARGELRRKIVSLRDDADLIGDADLVAQTRAALKEIDGGAGETALAASVDLIADGGAAPAPAISEETQRLLDTDAHALDAELLDIYLTEADEVLDTVDEGRQALAHNPGDRDALATVRRQFHTLKGSGRMVGLLELGELAWDVERLHNRLLEEDRRITPAFLALIGAAQQSFRHWVRELRESGRILTPPVELQAALRAVEAELPGGASGAAPIPARSHEPDTLAAIETPARAPSAPPALPFAPAGSGLPFEPLRPLVPVASIAAPESPLDQLPDLELFEFPELGTSLSEDTAPVVVTLEEAADETIDVGVPQDARESSKPMLRVVADNTAAHASSADTRIRASTNPAALTLLTDPQGFDAATDPEPGEVTVGAVTLSASLWRILCDEADQHIAVLQHEVSLLQFDPEHLPIATMLRASHTLCGIHRTGGIALIAVTARALEQALLALEQRGAPFPGSAHPVLARAAAGLAHFVSRVKRREGFTPIDEREAADIASELDELRQDALASVPPAARLPGDDENGIADAMKAPAAPAPGADLAAAPAQSSTTPAPVALEPDAIVPDPAPAPEPALVPASGPGQALTEASSSFTALALHAIAIEPRPVATDESLLEVADDVDETVLPIFLEEAAELFPQAGEQLRNWRRDAGDAGSVAQLRRTLHTLKGSARMAGAMRMGELAHRMESRLSTDELQVAPTPELFDALDTDLDRIAFVFDALREGRSNVALPWLSTAATRAIGVVAPGLGATATQAGAATGAASQSEAASATVAASAAVPAPDSPRKSAGAEGAEFDGAARAMLRVRADIVDRLVNEAGEVAIARARVEGELRALKANLMELTGSVIRLRSQVREIELQAETQIQSRMSAARSSAEDFDPLELDRYTRFQELTRSFAEGVNDVSTVQQALLKNLDDADAALLAQARLSRDVQQRLFAIRTVPFSSMSERLYRILRKTARELGKRANLEIEGAQTELDRSVLERLVGPLEHLLRNALDHGIEGRGVRLDAGKSEIGEITLKVRQIGNEIAIELADDGSGIDLARVRERIIAAGLVAPDADLTEQQLIEYLFRPGVTTAMQVTQISGRGIGLDVVRSEIVALGGRVDVSSMVGKGTLFKLFLPLTLAVAQAVLVRAGGRMWALPAPMVEQVQQVKADVLARMYDDGNVDWHGRAYPFHYLPRLLGDMASVPQAARHNTVLLVKSGQGLVAVHADEMIGNQEIVVKNIGPQLARLPGVSGATVLGTGEIVLIINPVQLAQRTGVRKYHPGDGAFTSPAVGVAAVKSARKLVMVVDDSLTVRKFTTRLLTREGFDVVAARDGIDALQVLAERTPDVILLDIEMPRMDGFEFAKTIKNDAKTARIPVIMITSRTAEKHRRRAAELGVDAFLGKPYQEDELLRNLRGFLGTIATA